jgi:hypothetical protein
MLQFSQENKDRLAFSKGKKAKIENVDFEYLVRKHPVLKTPLQLVVKVEGRRGTAEAEWDPRSGAWNFADIIDFLFISPEATGPLLKLIS